MTAVELLGRITEEGKLEIDLPEGLPPGDVRITIETLTEEQAWEERPWTEEEIQEMLTFRPATGAEIVASGAIGGWADQGIEDSVEWVEEQRRKRREQRGWQ
jgi:hypothetical protein